MVTEKQGYFNGLLGSIMFRRCVSFLVIVGLLASQLAAIPHAHGAMSAEEQQKHDTTPHVHFFAHGKHCHSHSHAHGHCHCHQSDKAQPASKSPNPRQPTRDGFDHDQTAIYLGAAEQLTLASNSTSMVPVAIADLPSTVDATIYGFEGASVLSLPWHPPDEVADDSQAYLTLRTLRI
jgi:hypothetical protein